MEMMEDVKTDAEEVKERLWQLFEVNDQTLIYTKEAEVYNCELCR